MTDEIIDLDRGEEEDQYKVIALGNFDGIHLGHQALMKKDLEVGKKDGLLPSVLLFKENSKLKLKAEKNYLTSLEDKIEILKELGIGCFCLLDFSEDLMKLSPEDFIREILVEKLKAKSLVVGGNYSFGYKAGGDIETLKSFQDKYGYKVYVCDYVKAHGRIINSTDIRKMLTEGRVREANADLGRPYKIKGKVVDGAHRGRKLNFPTANIDCDFSYVVPKIGVYLTKIYIDGASYYAITDVGKNPTFENDKLKIEAHILNFSENIYGKEVSLEFLDYFRGDFAFNTAQELIDQIERDKERALRMIESGEV